MQEPYSRQMFQQTLDSLQGRETTIVTLIDVADGNRHAPFNYAWVLEALESRDLVVFIMPHYDAQIGMFTDDPPRRLGCELTDYGRAFVAWLREPRDIPTQMSLFDG